VSRRIGAVAVVVPARDEEDGIEACLAGIAVALGRLPADVATSVTVVLDRCTDRTPQIVDAVLAGRPGAGVLQVGALAGRRPATHCALSGPTHIVAGSGVGALRDLGVRDALDRLRPLHPERVWVLSTDADTTVPPDWATAHLHLATAGAAGVAGMADLALPRLLSAAASRRHDELVRDLVDGSSHAHVYGANLGVRGDAYLAVGGFPPDGAGEDHGLWAALRVAGYPVRQPTSLRVLTSARTVGRATGGLADLLQSLHDPHVAAEV
jgi:hypothetical protein